MQHLLILTFLSPHYSTPWPYIPHPFIFLLFWLFFSPFFDYKNLLFLFQFNPYFARTKWWIISLSLSLSLSLSIYIYIYIYSLFWWMFEFFRLINFYVLLYFRLIWFSYILIYYLFNFIIFFCNMLSFEIIEWFTIIFLHSMTWIIWCLELYIFLLNIFLLILFYIIYYLSHILFQKGDCSLSLSLSQLLILSWNCKFRLMNFFVSLILDETLWWCVFWVINLSYVLSIL